MQKVSLEHLKVKNIFSPGLSLTDEGIPTPAKNIHGQPKHFGNMSEHTGDLLLEGLLVENEDDDEGFEIMSSTSSSHSSPRNIGGVTMNTQGTKEEEVKLTQEVDIFVPSHSHYAKHISEESNSTRISITLLGFTIPLVSAYQHSI